MEVMDESREGRRRAYESWRCMMRRCLDRKHKSYSKYGGRGIGVAPEFRTFEGFFAYMGPRPVGFTLERIDFLRSYEPENVKWASRVEQQSNQRDSVKFTFRGKSQTIAMWAREIEIPRHTLYWRIRIKGWELHEALTTPQRAWQRSA